MDAEQETVYGERVGDLLPGLFAFKDAMSIDDDGMYRSSVTLQPAIGAPLSRALMRAEAELLQDAADVGTSKAIHRTYEQRAADAFVRLVQRVGRSGRGNKSGCVPKLQG